MDIVVIKKNIFSTGNLSMIRKGLYDLYMRFGQIDNSASNPLSIEPGD